MKAHVLDKTCWCEPDIETGPGNEYDVWVVSDASGELEPYTRAPFKSRRAATAWAKKYIPEAKSYVRIH